MLEFFKNWQDKRRQRAVETKELDAFIASFVAERKPEMRAARSSRATNPLKIDSQRRAAELRYAWKCAFVLMFIHYERSDDEKGDFFAKVTERITKIYFEVAPHSLYGQAKLGMSWSVFLKIRKLELARMSMLVCAKCAAPGAAISTVLASSIDCPKCGSRFKSGVYIMSNAAMPGLVKIGHTQKSLQERLAQLSSSTSVPVPFVVEAWFPCAPSLARQFEQRAHDLLASTRKPAREFFEVSVAQAIEIVQGLVGQAPERP